MIDKKPGLWIYPDGREVIQKTAAGRKILHERWMQAWNDSGGICCLCQRPLSMRDASLEHKRSKGMSGGTHDDRQENLGISHYAGNVAKNSLSLEKYLQLPLDVRIRNCRG